MFAGIIEATEPVLNSRAMDQSQGIVIRRPQQFEDIKTGDSISVNGVCLTLESFDSKAMNFTLGYETLKILGTELESWLRYPVNVERSLCLGDRIHGHLVTGHVEKLLQVVKSEEFGDNWLLGIELTPDLNDFCWSKGSVALNGVSLTINSLENQHLEVCLIPETQKRTNLCHYKIGERICFEPDSFAKAVNHVISQRLKGDRSIEMNKS